MNMAIGKTLVAGAGLSGIRSALDLAETGYKVLLVDTADHIGGLLCQLDYQFPTSTCGYCRMLPMFDRDQSSQHCLRKGLAHENIEILLSTQLISVEGEPGDLTVTLKTTPSLIDPSLCTGCGDCEQVCPVSVDYSFNEGLTKRKAVYLPSPQSFSNAYTIDYAACTRCGECEKVCSAGAIKFVDQDREKFRILVVDDEKIVRESTQEWLKEEGFSVTTADSGQKALELMDDAPFNMMLTDIKMPGMDGVELLEKAKQKDPDLCVIMMTAYAAVDSAVEAMKQGALDYLTKPFDPDVLTAMVIKVYQAFEIAEARVEKVDALILSGGTQFFRPDTGKNPYGYGVLPGVLTSMEFERLISGTGPEPGELNHPNTGKRVRKIAWFQCVGSRDVQTQTPFCSSVCCMMSIKEAILAREKFGPDIETTIFYMDMRTIGKSFEAYKINAQKNNQVRFVRARIHSLSQAVDTNDMSLLARYVDIQGTAHEDDFDLVVLATGQQPARQMTEFAVTHHLETNPWGFVQPGPFSMVQTSREGIFSGGSLSGLKDIGDSVTCASAAALGACKIMVQAGKQTIQADGANSETANGSEIETLMALVRETPRILTVLCACRDKLFSKFDVEAVKTELGRIPEIESVEIIDDFCKAEGVDQLVELVTERKPNRLVIGACLPGIKNHRIKAFAAAAGFPASLVETLDMLSVVSQYPDPQGDQVTRRITRELTALISKARFNSPLPGEPIVSNQNAVVIGGGIAGMTAALSIADCGFHVDLIEKSDSLGGNLLWMDKTIDNSDIPSFLEDQVKRIEAHDHIMIHPKTQIETSENRPGEFATVLIKENEDPQTVYHGVTILATGGSQAPLELSGEENPLGEMTQKAFETGVQTKTIDPEKLETVVMIQCSGTRDEKRNYCSRVCCIRALKNALFLKEKNPDIQVYILYRDMMSYGFYEEYYTRAKNLGVIFFQYDPEDRPVTQVQDGKVLVKTRDLLLDMPVEIESDCVIHATGIVPDLPEELVDHYGVTRDVNHFFQGGRFKISAGGQYELQSFFLRPDIKTLYHRRGNCFC
jgi:heterodisulfide reductase subunit A